MKGILKEGWYTPRFALAALLAVLALSLILFFLMGNQKRRVILFFPKDDLVSVAGDFHIIPVRKDRSQSMELLLGEALLEPFDYHLNETVPNGVVINSFIYDREKSTIYADLSIELVSPDDDKPNRVDPARMLEILERNIRFNYRKVENVKFTVDGQVPNSHVFSGSVG